MMLQNLRNEDVSSNRARRFFFFFSFLLLPLLLAHREATNITAEHVCLCSSTQRRLEKV